MRRISLTIFEPRLNLKLMTKKKSSDLNNLPIVISLLALVLTLPLLVWAVFQKQDTRNRAAEPEIFPQVDLNNDGVINSVDLKIYQEKFASPKP